MVAATDTVARQPGAPGRTAPPHPAVARAEGAPHLGSARYGYTFRRALFTADLLGLAAEIALTHLRLSVSGRGGIDNDTLIHELPALRRSLERRARLLRRRHRPGTLGAPADFNERSIATLSRSSSHTIRMTIDFNDGPANDVVQVFVDGTLVATGGSWEDYYRFDPEQAGGGNLVPTVDKVLFRESGTADPGNSGQGFLIDNIGLTSSPTPTTPSGGGAGGGVAGATGKKCKKQKKHHTRQLRRCKKHKKHH